MNLLFPLAAGGLSVYTLAAWVKNRVAPAGNLDKSSVASSASQRRDQAAQLCAT